MPANSIDGELGHWTGDPSYTLALQGTSLIFPEQRGLGDARADQRVGEWQEKMVERNLLVKPMSERKRYDTLVWAAMAPRKSLAPLNKKKTKN
jgi:hypothetical protein